MEQSHVSALQLKHAGLERQIQEELSRPMPDLAMVQALKKRKLRIKEELAAITNPDRQQGTLADALRSSFLVVKLLMFAVVIYFFCSAIRRV